MSSSVSIGVLVVTHGELASELVAAARTIAQGSADHLRAISVGWNDDMAQARERVRQQIESCDQGRGVIVLSDMFGGTPTNLCLSCLASERVEIVTGVNLPMVVKTANLGSEVAGQMSLRALAERIASKGRDSIIVAGSMLEPDADDGTSEDVPDEEEG